MSAVENKKAKAPRPKSQSPKRDEDFIPRPDRSKFLDELNAHRKQLDEHRATLNKHKQTIDQEQSAAAQSPEEIKLREEHSAVLAERNRLKDAEKRINSEAQRIEDSVKSKLAELQLLRPKGGPRSAKEVDQQIQKLDSQVESGGLSIAAENRALKEISALKKQRASFERADKLQAEIDEVRKKAAEVRKTVDAAAMRQVQATKAELEKKLDALKVDRQAVRNKLNSSFDGRREAHAAIKDLNAKIDALRKNFDAEMAAFNEKMKAKKQQREAEEAEAKVQAAKQKKIAAAEAKVAAAREPAYGAQIEKAQALLTHFDPTAKADTADKETETAVPAAPTNKTSSVAKALNAPAPTGRTLQPSTGSAPPSRKSQKQKNRESTGSQPLHLDLNIIDALSSLKISLPTSSEQLEATKTQIREKIEYFKENNKRVTEERVQRAEEELKKVRDEIEAEAEAAKSALKPE